MKRVLFASLSAVLLVSFGTACKDAAPSTPPSTSSTPPAGGAAPPMAEEFGHGGVGVDLGQVVAGPFTVVVSRGTKMPPGKDVHLDIEVKGGAFAAARAWVGSADGAGALKEKASVEDKADPTKLHCHAELANPIPADAMLHVEVEAPDGAKHLASFDLKRG